MIINDVKVTINYDRTCTCKLNSSLHIASGLIQNGIVYTSAEVKGQVYLACSVVCGNVPSSTLCIPNYLLKGLHLKADDFITLSVLDPSIVPLLSSVSLDATAFGLDILRSSEAHLEQGFLLQCSFVYLGMQVPVWCGSQLVYCTVDNFHPISIESRCGRLGVNTTLHLDCRQTGRTSGGQAVALGDRSAAPDSLPPVTAGAALVASDDDVIGPTWLPKVTWLLVDFICRWLLGYGLGLGQLLRLRAACRKCIGRLTAGPTCASPLGAGMGFQRPVLLQVRPIPDASSPLAEPNCGLVNRRHLPPTDDSSSAVTSGDSRWCLVQVEQLGPRDLASASEASLGPLLLKLLPCDSVPPDCLRLTQAGAAAAGLACGAWVRLSRPPLLPEGSSGDATSAFISGCLRLKELRIAGASDSVDATRRALESFIKTRTADNPALILHKRRLAFTDADGVRHACSTELIFNTSGLKRQKQPLQQPQPPQLPCALLCRELSPRLSISTAEAATPVSTSGIGQNENSEDQEDEDRQMPDWLADALDPLVSNLIGQFNAAVSSPRRLSYLALLRDDSGATSGGQGKTALLRRFASRLRLSGCHAGDPVDCRRLARLEFASAHRRLWRMARLAAARAPACLLLDNLEAVCAPIEDGLVGTGAEAHLQRLCHQVRSLLKWIRHQPGVMLLATAGGPLNAQLIDSATGQCLFDTDDRLDIRLPPTDSMRRLLMLPADGGDIGKYLSIGEFARCSRILAYCTPEAAAQLDLEVALGAVRQAREECDPARSRLPLEYDQICGLDSAKAVLERAIIWPLRFPLLVRRVRGATADASGAAATVGVLLTGPSGCGKSLLARALARKLRLRLLAVRGPELLSKFVGASERAVRDLFAKARRLRPCLVLLDEVDALAPRRGNDSTGVTDRVVNQLLTELDGIDTDGLAGVALLAATNRPDLVDPALLRPGRIGLRAVCPPPGRDDRQRILESLLTADGFGEAIDDDLLGCIADATEGYCSADFNALLLAATVDTADGCRYGRRELMSALAKVRPSMTLAGSTADSSWPTSLQPGRRVMFA